MLFAILCNDKANSLQMRLDTRPAHLDYISSYGAAVQFAGPFLDEDGKPNGSMIMFEAENQQEAELFAKNDPYALAGLFETVSIRPWIWVINKPSDD